MTKDKGIARVRVPQLGALKVFEVVARHESLVRAAEELGVPYRTVGKQIKMLENELGEELFMRRERAMMLTERARGLAARVQTAFSSLDEALLAFRERRMMQPLVVSCEPTLSLKLLIPLQGDLLQETGVAIHVLAAQGAVDFNKDHVDLVIRRDDRPIDGLLYSRVLSQEAMVPVCAPDKWPEQRPRELSALYTKGRAEAWETWQRSHSPLLTGRSRVAYDYFYQAIEAAMAGQGMVLASAHMVQQDIAEKRLLPLTAPAPDGTHYLALSNRPFEADERMTRFVPWLAAKMQANLARQGRDGRA